MRRIFESLGKHPLILPVLAMLMLPFALFVNLGLMPLISDEPTRAIVSLEMILSGNYITPTINGEFYYNKPPLFNWILAGFIHTSGVMNEFIFRLPTVLSLFFTALIIYLFSKKALGKTNAILAGLMLITSARILFWDSFQGLIDITYTFITFTSFAALYYFSQKRKWLLMFTMTYALAATGFLMKGLPSIAFQGISLIAWLLYERSFKKVFSLHHLAGILIFALIAGSYYYAYLQSNSLHDVFSTLFDQSNRINDKTGTILSWSRHLIIFPFEMSYEFAPWTLLLLLLIDKNIRKATFSDKFYIFCLLIFASNIIIYWISADMRPRYLFMLFPLIFLTGIKAWSEAEKFKPKIYRLINLMFQLLAFAGAFSLLFYLFWDETNRMAGVRILIPVLFLLSLAAAFLTIKLPRQRIALLIIVLLTVRIGFSAYNLPARYNSYPDAGYRDGEIVAGQMLKGYETFVLGDTPFNHDASFYISRASSRIITRVWGISNNQACYITDEINLAKFAGREAGFVVIHEFTIKLNETRLFLIKKSS